MRYLKAFFTALQMTIRGESPESRRYPNLYAWMLEGQTLSQAAYAAAEADKMDLAARKAFMLRLDGRQWSMELVLSSVKFHMTKEYPSLLRTPVEHNLTTFYALNLDDQYRVSKLAEEALAPTVKNAVQALALHLKNIPSSKNP